MKTQFGKIRQASFTPPWWASNAHAQTIYPKFFLGTPDISFIHQRIDTPDGDFLDLALNIPESATAIVLLFHGLEGSKDSHYIRHLSYELAQMGIASVVMHFRGCSGEVNKMPRAYHSGEVTDAQHTINWITQRYSHLKLFTVGFSLGGNMLLKLLSQPHQFPIEAAVSVSAPINLAASADTINRGFARAYQAHLLKSMKTTLLAKMQMMDMSAYLALNEEQIRQLNSFQAFDQHVTSQLHGFADAADYYQRASALPDLHKVNTPTLLLHAADDPFMDSRVIPSEDQLSPTLAYELSQAGGHVGFLGGTLRTPKLWLPQRITQFISEYL
jgi:predicted alpha/beta-fold hydrolase